MLTPGIAIVLAVATIVGAAALVGEHMLHAFSRYQQIQTENRSIADTTQRLLVAIGAAEADQRGYLIARLPELLDHYHAAVGVAEQSLNDLGVQAASRPWLRSDEGALQAMVHQKIAEMDRSVAGGGAAQPAAGTPAAVPALDDGTADRIRDLCIDIGARSESDLNQRAARAQDREHMIAVAVLAAAAAVAALLGAAALGLMLSRSRLLRMQAIAREQSERLQSTVNEIRDGVAVFDAENRLLLWNRAFFPATGFPTVLAQPGTAFAAFSVAAEAWSPPFLADERPGPEPQLTEARRGSRMLEIWRSAMPDGGQMIAVADITRRAEAEAIAGQAQKMEALGQLTGGVAHDFNNLLQVVSANLELIGGRLGEEPWLRARLDAALAGVDRGARLTRHLLAFARRQSLAPLPLDSARLLVGMEEMLRRTLGDGIAIELVTGPALWAVRADPQQLENAVLNLAINARDAMSGGGRLTIEARNAALDDGYAAANADVSPGQYVMIAVSDTGIGMTADQIVRAVEPFYTTKPEGRGTGLGLSMVYGFARQSGGHLKLYSEPGHGTTVRLYIPRTTDLPRTTTSDKAEITPARGEMVLLVDDDTAVRLATAQALRSLGYRLVEVDSTEAALERLRDGPPPDLLFTDVVMPGVVTARALAEQARAMHPGIAVVFTSGTIDDSGQRDPVDPGTLLVPKPWKLDDLARQLRAALDRAGHKPESSRPLRILVTDDDPLVRTTTADLLTELGHDVRQAGSGAESLRMLDGVHLLLTDLVLPDLDGRGLVRAARAQRPDLRVIIATGHDHEEPGDETLIWLEKPYDEYALRSALARAVLAEVGPA